jgi:succinate dehydrogenase / fumarate reductase membrane anchor subunit
MSRKASGFHAWIYQRITAIYLGLYFLYLLFHFITDAPGDYLQLREWLAHPAVNITMAIFFVALLLHAWVGIRDAVIDYVQPITIRLSVLSLVALYLIACGFWLLRTLIVITMT